MIYTYIALGIFGLYSIISTGAYLEEKKAHKRTAIKARKIIDSKDEILENMLEENARLSLVAKTYRTLVMLTPAE